MNKDTTDTLNRLIDNMNDELGEALRPMLANVASSTMLPMILISMITDDSKTDSITAGLMTASIFGAQIVIGALNEIGYPEIAESVMEYLKEELNA
jgi:hypothetical protein